MPQAEACRAVWLSQTWTRISSSCINVQQRPNAEYSICTGGINGPLSPFSKLTVSLYGINNSSFSQRKCCHFNCSPNVGSVGCGWRAVGLVCVCVPVIYSCSPAECHVVAGHPAGCNDRLHSNLPDSQQEKTSSQLLIWVWNDVSILLLCSPHPHASPAYSLSELTLWASYYGLWLSELRFIKKKMYLLELLSHLWSLVVLLAESSLGPQTFS